VRASHEAICACDPRDGSSAPVREWRFGVPLVRVGARQIAQMHRRIGLV
jgi:hypothetical protein